MHDEGDVAIKYFWGAATSAGGKTWRVSDDFRPGRQLPQLEYSAIEMFTEPDDCLGFTCFAKLDKLRVKTTFEFEVGSTKMIFILII